MSLDMAFIANGHFAGKIRCLRLGPARVVMAVR